MRRKRLLLVVVLLLLCVSSPARAGASDGRREVAFGPVRFSVPESWPVINLASAPRTCVRLDVHAAYLGAPGTDQDCPAGIAGRADAIVVRPMLEGERASRSVVDGTITLPVPAAGVTFTGVFASSDDAISGVLRSVRVVGDPLPLAHASSAASPANAPGEAGGVIFTGGGFDACTAPSEGAMSAWQASNYRSVGVYIGGIDRACAQPNLTRTWVSDEVSRGWHLVPIYVGRQAPCRSGLTPIDPANADAQGKDAADDASNLAAALGIGKGSPIYYDMEAYARSASCSRAVITFLDAWTFQLHNHGYQSGIYGSAASVMADQVAQIGTGYIPPDDIWIAHWNGVATTQDAYVPDAYWAFHQRLHQYSGGHNETYGGVTINIDSSWDDGLTGYDDHAPVSGVPTGSGVAVAAVAPVTGTSSDDLTGVAAVTVTFAPVTAVSVVQPTSVAASLDCPTSRRSCTYSADPPAVPGVYTVTAAGVDVAGNAEQPGPAATIVVL